MATGRAYEGWVIQMMVSWEICMLWNLGAVEFIGKEMLNFLPDVYNKLLILVRDYCEPDEQMHLEVNEAIIPFSHPKAAVCLKLVILKYHQLHLGCSQNISFATFLLKQSARHHLQPPTP